MVQDSPYQRGTKRKHEEVDEDEEADKADTVRYGQEINWMFVRLFPCLFVFVFFVCCLPLQGDLALANLFYITIT